VNAHSTTVLDTRMQRQDKVYVATNKLSVLANAQIKLFSVTNAKTKTQLILICQTFHFAYKIQQNFTN